MFSHAMYMLWIEVRAQILALPSFAEEDVMPWVSFVSAGI